ncbi:ACT domain-containing protein ACR1-like isoform X2 [Macadamia integrifolia]|uniref:ACT domain-containing protein ACR1-like isoform X2 n=1 Tax=Macadamia integrifolia TaxID=60698 RepID=UPI001C4F2AF5|nr:ACT domain-containing protein ACR1-like isoform X2 [Macadamia integrifolia]
MESVYEPYFDPDFDSLIERIHPPRVCIDNDTRQDCTLVKVDSANKHGILLEMVQVLTDLDLVISKSYISSDGGWFMDDQLGHKLTDQSLIHYIQQALGAETRRGKGKGSEVETCLGWIVRPRPVSSTDYTAIEMTALDRPGLLSEIAAVLANLGCHVVSSVAWTHNDRAASIFYVEDVLSGGGPICYPERLSHVEKQLDNVVGAHHHHHQLPELGRSAAVRLSTPVGGRSQMERRLHQLMSAMDLGVYDWCCCCSGDGMTEEESRDIVRGSTSEVSIDIESCNERGYSVVNVRSKDRPKLLFDTVCTLTDMKYVVFHATVSSKASLAVQEYYIRHLDGCTLDTEAEKRIVTQGLVAAIERRASHGLRLDVCTGNRVGLLSDVTRVFREHGLSVASAEIGTRGERAIGSFHVTDVSGNEVDSKTVELVRREIGGTILEVQKIPAWLSRSSSCSSSSSSGSSVEKRPRFSLGGLLWAKLERLSNNLGSIRP